MDNRLLQQLKHKKSTGAKSFAVLIDPDNLVPGALESIALLSAQHGVDYFFVGGSLITGNAFHQVIAYLKKHTDIPVVLFPGNNLHIDPSADAILLLSLISGRNPDFLIGQHVIAAPILKRSRLEILSTGYILVESGKATTVSYISNTHPIPYDKPAIAACTALAGEMLGMQLIYMDAGSGAQKPVSPRMIATVRRSIDLPLIVGGGINTLEKAVDAYKAGADLVVVGNGIEEDPSLLIAIAERVQELNAALVGG